MATKYIKFQSSDENVFSDDCTTRWPDSVECNIPMSGLYEDKYTNLMIMIGDENLIDAWLADNTGKVIEVDEDTANSIGRMMVPEGTESVIDEQDADRLYRKTYIAGLFTITSGKQLWTLDNIEDITPE